MCHLGDTSISSHRWLKMVRQAARENLKIKGGCSQGTVKSASAIEAEVIARSQNAREAGRAALRAYRWSVLGIKCGTWWHGDTTVCHWEPSGIIEPVELHTRLAGWAARYHIDCLAKGQPSSILASSYGSTIEVLASECLEGAYVDSKIFSWSRLGLPISTAKCQSSFPW